jgi:hypothetical protein
MMTPRQPFNKRAWAYGTGATTTSGGRPYSRMRSVVRTSQRMPHQLADGSVGIAADIRRRGFRGMFRDEAVSDTPSGSGRQADSASCMCGPEASTASTGWSPRPGCRRRQAPLAPVARARDHASSPAEARPKRSLRLCRQAPPVSATFGAAGRWRERSPLACSSTREMSPPRRSCGPRRRCCVGRGTSRRSRGRT